MKYIITLLFILICFAHPVYSENNDYDSLYEKAEPFKSKLYNDIDPFQDEDIIRYTWSPYPLFRTSAFLYFKNITIEPGYYIITPRTLGSKDYILFKQNGKVQFIIPVVKKEKTPLNFYDANTPKLKLTKWQEFTSGVKKKFYNTARDSMRIEPPKSLVNVEVETKYIIMTVYYGDDKYTALFMRSPY